MLDYRTQRKIEDELDRKKRLNEFAEHIRSGGKVYKTLASCAIAGVFIAFGFLVFAITGLFHLSATVVGLTISIIVVSLGLITILPWVRRIEKGELKKMSIIFISLIGVVVLLWLISVWIVIILMNSGSASIEAGVVTFNIVKATIVISAQLIISSTIANVILKYKKSFIPFQVITYLSYLFIDVYLCILAFSVNITFDSVWVSDSIGVLGNRYMITFLILSIVYSIVSSSVMKSIEVKKTKRVTDAVTETTEEAVKENEETKPVEKKTKSVTERLEDLKVMRDNNLITQEEYDAKKAEILKDM